MQKEKEKNRRELDRYQVESKEKIDYAQFENERIQNKLNMIEKSLENKKKKNSDLKEEKQELMQKLVKVREELSKSQIQNNATTRALAESEKLLETRSYNPGDMSPEIVNLIKTLKDQLSMLEDAQGEKAFDKIKKIYDEMESIISKQRERSAKIREKYTKKFDDMKAQIEQDRETDKKKINLLINSNDELKSKLMNLQDRVEELEKKEAQLDSVIFENSKLNEALSYKECVRASQVELVEKFKRDIEKISSQQLEWEQRLAIMSAEKSNLISLRETFPYVLKESLKFMNRQKNNLKHSLRNLTEEDLAAVKEAFSEAGLSINF